MLSSTCGLDPLFLLVVGLRVFLSPAEVPRQLSGAQGPPAGS